MAEVVTTLKGDGAAPWIVVHAESAAETEKVLGELAEGLMQSAVQAADLLTGVVQTEKALNKPAFITPGPAPAPAPVQWGQPAAPAQAPADWQNGAQPAPWGQPAAPGGFVGSVHPEGKRCELCSSVLIGKQPKVKRMWSCPNQQRPQDGHTVIWING